MYGAMSGRGEAGLDRLKSTLYARMEQMSFRSGAAVFVGVPVAAAVAITLAVALGGQRAAAPSPLNPPRPAAVRSTPPPSPAASPSATARAVPAASLMPADGRQPPAPVTAVTTRAVSASSAVGLPTSRFPHPSLIAPSLPAVPGSGGLSWLSRAGASGWRRDGLLDRDGGGLLARRLGR